jgi:hypothetical protein
MAVRLEGKTVLSQRMCGIYSKLIGAKQKD